MNMKLPFQLLLIVFALFSCEPDEEINTLTVSKNNIEFTEEGGKASFILETNADSWEVTNPAADWLSIPISSGTQQEALVSLSVDTKTVLPRTDTLTITAGNAKPLQIIVSQLTVDYLHNLSSNNTLINLKRSGTATSVKISTDASSWKLKNTTDWLQLSDTTGESGATTISISAEENTGKDKRTATLVLSAEFAPSIEITVTQNGELYPSYNTSPIDPDPTGMNSTATEIAAKINLGWNIGNTLEATGGETAWGNPMVTEELIKLVKANGFNAIRIPCAWSQYMENSATAELKTQWLNRVKGVVQYCVNNDLYVLLNIHWDGGWLENNCTPARQEDNNARQKAFWEQIATHMRDFDEHLMFASANEPNVDNATQMAVLNSYHQTFIDAVRSTGGKNTYRVLVVQGPATDIEKTNKLMKTLPVDNIPNKLMVEVHFYTPWNFCGMTEDANWGNQFYYWGEGNHSTTDTEHNPTYGEENDMDLLFAKMKTQFVDKGIPVLMGEYGAIRRSELTGDALELHLKSRAYYLEYVTKQMKANELLPFYWDNGGLDNEAFGIFNRATNTVFDQQALDALVKGAQ